MDRKNILLLGAGDLMYRSILKLRSAGYKVFAVDKNPESFGFKFTDGYQVVDIVDEASITAYAKKIDAQCIVAANDAGVLAAAISSEKLGLKNISVRTAQIATDKGLMRETWKKDNLSQPVFVICENSTVIGEMVSQFGLPCVLKPCLNWGSKGVSLIMNKQDIDFAVSFALQNNRNNRFIIERYIEGTELTVEGLVVNGIAKILAYSDKEHQQHDRYKVAMSLNYPALVETETFLKLQELIINAVNSLGIKDGAFHCECMLKGKDIFLIEMAARPGGGHIFTEIVEAVSGINMPVTLSKIFLNESITIPENINYSGACYRFFSPPKGLFISIENLDMAKESEGVVDIGFKLESGKVIDVIPDDTARPGYVVTKGNNRETALNNAVKAISKLRFTMQ